MIGHLVDEGEANVASEISDSNQKEQNLNIDQSAENLDNFISTPSKLEENEVIPDVFIDNYTITYDIIENANDMIEIKKNIEMIMKSLKISNDDDEC